jgi:hypothetical protein
VGGTAVFREWTGQIPALTATESVFAALDEGRLLRVGHRDLPIGLFGSHRFGRRGCLFHAVGSALLGLTCAARAPFGKVGLSRRIGSAALRARIPRAGAIRCLLQESFPVPRSHAAASPSAFTVHRPTIRHGEWVAPARPTVLAALATSPDVAEVLGSQYGRKSEDISPGVATVSQKEGADDLIGRLQILDKDSTYCRLHSTRPGCATRSSDGRLRSR